MRVSRVLIEEAGKRMPRGFVEAYYASRNAESDRPHTIEVSDQHHADMRQWILTGVRPTPGTGKPAVVGWQALAPKLWRMIESRADNFSGDVAAEKKFHTVFRRWICCSCRRRWDASLKRTPLADALVSRDAYRRWVRARHNEVNVSLGRLPWPDDPDHVPTWKGWAPST